MQLVLQRARRFSAIRAALAWTAAAVAALSGLAGACVIPDRSFVEDPPAMDVESSTAAPSAPSADSPTAPDAGSPQVACEEYCDAVLASCVGSSQLYTDRPQCLAVCNALPPGTPGARSGNSVACRLSLVNGPGFEANSCSDVGPVSRGQCGSSCQAFCALRRAGCSAADATNLELAPNGYCELACEQLTNSGSYSVAMAGGVPAYEGADTLQCRLGHLVTALANPELSPDECAASSIVPPNQLVPCQDAIDISLARDRETYCRLVQYACSGNQAVYESVDDCEAVSATFERGMPDDTAANTLRCRRYHAYNAFEDPGTHCTHAGPTGDGTCAAPEETQEGNCISYCRILERACPAAYESRGEGAEAEPLEACLEECLQLPDAAAGGFRTEPRYSVGVMLPGGTLKCRTLYAVRALEVPDGPDCEAAIGAENSACETPVQTADPS